MFLFWIFTVLPGLLSVEQSRKYLEGHVQFGRDAADIVPQFAQAYEKNRMITPVQGKMAVDELNKLCKLVQVKKDNTFYWESPIKKAVLPYRAILKKINAKKDNIIETNQ